MMIQKRAALDPRKRLWISEAVVKRFLTESGIADGEWPSKRVGLHRALGSEFELRGLESELLRLGAQIFFPRIRSRKDKTMDFAAGPLGLPGGAFKLEEPPRDRPAISPGDLDLIFVPGLIFGPAGERMGWGAGYYDRFLPLAPRAIRVVLTFDFQVLPALSQEPWDQRVDWIWTESREIRTQRVALPVRNQQQ